MNRKRQRDKDKFESLVMSRSVAKEIEEQKAQQREYWKLRKAKQRAKEKERAEKRAGKEHRLAFPDPPPLASAGNSEPSLHVDAGNRERSPDPALLASAGNSELPLDAAPLTTDRGNVSLLSICF